MFVITVAIAKLPLWLLIPPSCLCGFGDFNSVNVCFCVCRKRRLIKGYKLPYITGCPIYKLHALRRMSLDSWALGCPGSGNTLFQRRMSSFS